MSEHGARAERFRERLFPIGFTDDLEVYLRATEQSCPDRQALLHRAYGAYLCYYAVREELDATLGEIIAHERYHENDTNIERH